MSLLGEIQKLIEEHGSAAILEQRLKFWQEKLEALDKENKEVKAKLALIESDNQGLQKRLAENERQIGTKDLRSQLRFEKNTYVAANGEIPGYGKGPFCTNCFDTSEKLINLHHKMAGFINNVSWYKWECPKCKATVSAPNPPNEQ